MDVKTALKYDLVAELQGLEDLLGGMTFPDNKSDLERINELTRRIRRMKLALDPQLVSASNERAAAIQAAGSIVSYLEERLQTSSLQMAISALVRSKRTHYTCDDSWYSCPKSEEGCADEGAGKDCTCGADAHNAYIDSVVRNMTR